MWYRQVQDETMAPARMVMFIEQHADRCDICLSDSELKGEIAKITELILPESKIPKAVRKEQVAVAEEKKAEEAEGSTDPEGEEEETYGYDDED